MSQAANWGVMTSGPASAAQLAARINESLNAILSSHAGSSAPSYVAEGTIWLDTDDDSLYIRDGSANNVKLGSMSGGIFTPFLSGASLTAIRNQIIPPGVMWDWTTAEDPATYGFAYARGQAVTAAAAPTLRALYIAAGNPYGVVGADPAYPDMRGRLSAGKDDMGGTAANRITNAGGGIVGTTLGASGGAQNRTVALANLPSTNLNIASLGVAVTDPGHTHTLTNGDRGIENNTGDNDFNIQSGANNHQRITMSIVSATTGITADVNGTLPLGGSGTALLTLPPLLVVYKVVKAH